MDKPQMRTLSPDTDPETEAVWLAMLRGAPAHRKFAQVRSLSETVLSLSRRAIVRRNPGLNEDELAVLFVRHQYGEVLAAELEQYLNARSNQVP